MFSLISYYVKYIWNNSLFTLQFHLQPQYKYELFHIYFTSFHSSRKDMNSMNWPRSQCVASYSSVGRASHRYCGGHAGSNPVEALIFFRLFLSNCLSWKIYCDDHSSLLFHTMLIFKIDSVCSVIRSVTRYSHVRLSFLPMVLLVACTI